MTPIQKRVRWRPCWRLVASRFPPVSVFDRVARPEDLATVFEIESLTNDRLRNELGDLSHVPPAERVSGEGTTPIMAAFTHLNPLGSRFSDGSYGVYYAARSVDTAIAETAYHKARFLAATQEAAIEIDMRAYAADLDARLHDLRGATAQWPALFAPDPAAYAPAQAFARHLRDQGSNGVAYDSVRDPGGQCVAVFRPKVLSPVRQSRHFCYVWDGTRIATTYEKKAYPPRHDA